MRRATNFEEALTAAHRHARDTVTQFVIKSNDATPDEFDAETRRIADDSVRMILGAALQHRDFFEHVAAELNESEANDRTSGRIDAIWGRSLATVVTYHLQRSQLRSPPEAIGVYVWLRCVDWITLSREYLNLIDEQDELLKSQGIEGFNS